MLESVFWKSLWRLTGVIPRVGVFIWKSVQNASPVNQVLHIRIRDISSTCSICGEGEESVCHMLFYCPRSRAVWFASPFGLRSDNINGRLQGIVQDLWSGLNEGDKCLFQI